MKTVLLPEQIEELAAFPAAVRELIDAELAIGNPVVQIGHSFPAPPAGAYVRFGRRVSTRPHESDHRLEFRARYSSISSGEWTDAKRFYFVVEPPGEQPDDPDGQPPAPAPSPAPAEAPATRASAAELPDFEDPPAIRPSPNPLSQIPIRIADRVHRQPPRTTAYSGRLVVREMPAGVRFELPLRDVRSPVAMRALLEGILEVPLVCDMANARLHGADLMHRTNFAFELRLVVAAQHTNEYLLTITGSWADIAAKHHEYLRDRADGWFELWTRVWPPARWSRSPRHVPSLQDERLQAVLAEDAELASVEAIQARIIAGIKRGGWYSASDKEGTTRIFWNGMRYVRTGEGDHLPYLAYADEPAFLAALQPFCDVAAHRGSPQIPHSEREAWLLVLRQLKHPA